MVANDRRTSKVCTQAWAGRIMRFVSHTCRVSLVLGATYYILVTLRLYDSRYASEKRQKDKEGQ